MESTEAYTRELSSRYRRLFTLPKTYQLILYFLFSQASLWFTLDLNTPKLLIVYGAYISSLALNYLIALLLGIRIASFKRVLGLILADSIVVLSCTVPIRVVSLIWRVPDIGSIFSFGIVCSISLNFVVSKTVFTPKTLKTILFALTSPITIALIMYGSGTLSAPSTLAIGIDSVIILLTAVFVLVLEKKDRELGNSPLELLHWFLSAWIINDGYPLEKFFEQNSIQKKVSTTVLSINGRDKAYIIIPEVHPGPLHPVGSYNLPELFYEEFKTHGLAFVLHGTGSHENNIPTNELTRKYVKTVKDILDKSPARNTDVSGPVQLSKDDLHLTAIGFQRHALVILSFAPKNTDDVDPNIANTVRSAGNSKGITVTIVDAHNSLSDSRPSLPDIDWEGILAVTSEKGDETVMAGWMNSNDMDFEHGDDISEAGISVLVLKVGAEDWALISADSNNSLPGLREEIMNALRKHKIRLLEFCTTDTHMRAGKGLVTKGYHCLGEITPVPRIIKIVEEMAIKAKERQSSCSLSIQRVDLNVQVIGNKTIRGVAQLTQRSINFARNFAKLTALIFLFCISILYVF